MRLPLSLFLTTSLKTKRLLNLSHSKLHSFNKMTEFTSYGFLDVHAHLTHENFAGKEDEIAIKCKDAGVEYIVVNGLEPVSNRQILELCKRHSNLLPALGIYPLDAACNVITEETWLHEFPPPKKFDVDEEIEFIDKMAEEKKIAAIGECGLDKHYLTDEVSMKEQERVLRKLMKVAVKHNLPIILHSRKAEKRVFEMLQEEGVKKADFHCFGGKVKLGTEIANAGYYISIPSAVINENSPFRRLVAGLPLNRILTETDSPYMGPVRGVDNDPSTVVEATTAIASVKQVTKEDMKLTIRNNFRDLFEM